MKVLLFPVLGCFSLTAGGVLLFLLLLVVPYKRYTNQGVVEGRGFLVNSRLFCKDSLYLVRKASHGARYHVMMSGMPDTPLPKCWLPLFVSLPSGAIYALGNISEELLRAEGFSSHDESGQPNQDLFYHGCTNIGRWAKGTRRWDCPPFPSQRIFWFRDGTLIALLFQCDLGNVAKTTFDRVRIGADKQHLFALPITDDEAVIIFGRADRLIEYLAE